MSVRGFFGGEGIFEKKNESVNFKAEFITFF